MRNAGAPNRGLVPRADDLFVRRWGHGPPVVLLHGLGASSRYWDTLAALQPPFLATAPDLLGFGRSPKPPDATYDIDGHAASVVPLITPGSVLVGHSTGALIAAAVAARHAELVRALVLVGMPAYDTEEAAQRALARLGWLARTTAENRPSARWICAAMCRLRPLAEAAAPLVIRDLPRSVARDAVMHTWPSYSRTLRNVVVEYRPVPDLIAAQRPITLLYGNRDPESSAEAVRRLRAALEHTGARAELRIIDGDHHLPIREPAAVIETISAAIS
ncbi:MAG: alpha/beta fold hydrolase [Acidimicrobiia bacterium]